jgi:hypothetical protein
MAPFFTATDIAAIRKVKSKSPVGICVYHAAIKSGDRVGLRAHFATSLSFVGAPQQNPDPLHCENSGSGSKSPRMACFLVEEDV